MTSFRHQEGTSGKGKERECELSTGGQSCTDCPRLPHLSQVLINGWDTVMPSLVLQTRRKPKRDLWRMRQLRPPYPVVL